MSTETQIKTPIYDSPTFGKHVEYYSLSHVLSEQGIPNSVMIYILVLKVILWLSEQE